MTSASVHEGTSASRVVVDRLVPTPTVVAPATRNSGLANGVVVVIDDGRGAGRELLEKLNAEGLATAHLFDTSAGHDTDPLIDLRNDNDHSPESIPVDLSDEASIQSAVEDLRQSSGQIVAIVHLTALSGRAGPSVATNMLRLAQAVGPELAAAAESGGAAFISTTAMGGRFGIEDPSATDIDPWQGLTAGFVKSLGQEWPSVRVKVVDFGSTVGSGEIADCLIAELFSDDGPAEIGYDAGSRFVVELTQADLTDSEPQLVLDSNSIVVATGGARGITAAALAELAREHQPTLVILGRSDAVDDADEPTSGIVDPGDLKRLLFEAGKATGSTSAKEVEATYQQIIRSREVATNLELLRAYGAKVEYVQVDICDQDALASTIESIYERHGRIDGVVHGAGVVEDKLVLDKSAASFDRVVASKATAAVHLTELLRPETLRFVAFFSSVAGRFGSRGQADYAGASEVLNKLAQVLDRQWTARVVSINWGPWQGGGMISPEVRRQFTRRGIGLIPLGAGSQLFVQEIGSGAGPAEIVISAANATNDLPLLESASITCEDDGSCVIARRLDLSEDLYLSDHVIDDHPVLPFAMAMELMATAAAAARPELTVRALRKIRVHHGLVIDAEGADIELVATPRPPTNTNAASGARFSVTLSTQANRSDYSAVVDLEGADLSEADSDGDQESIIVPRPLLRPERFPMSMTEAYERWLFHGPLFQKIMSIEAVSDRGMTAMVEGSDPATCLRNIDERAHWILDPVLIDAALQAQVLWARQHWDITLLPAQIDEVRRLKQARPSNEPLRLEVRIQPSSRRPFCRADHWFFSSDGELLATLSGVEGVGTPALNRLAVR